MSTTVSLNKGQYVGNLTSLRCGNGIIASAAVAYVGEKGMDVAHRHENPFICLALEGGSIEKISRRSEERVAGDTTFCGAGEIHQVFIRTYSSKTVAFELENSFLLENEISESDIRSAVGQHPGAVKHKILRMYKELLTNDDFTDSSIQMILLSLIEDARKTSRQKKPLWVTRLYDLLNDRWNEQITLQELASALNVHPITVSKYFAKYFSCTLGEYMRRLKIGKSISLIKNSQLSLTETAFYCGFADQSHFTRNFKDLTGFLPKDFKKL